MSRRVSEEDRLVEVLIGFTRRELAFLDARGVSRGVTLRRLLEDAMALCEPEGCTGNDTMPTANFDDFCYVFDLKSGIFRSEMGKIASESNDLPDFAAWAVTFKGLLEKHRGKTATPFQIVYFLQNRFDQIKEIS